MNAPLSAEDRSVQRFSGWGIAMMQQKPTAEYVLASDYDAAIATIERLQMRVAALAELHYGRPAPDVPARPVNCPKCAGNPCECQHKWSPVTRG